MSKRLLILGAGPFQVRGIKLAVDHGFHVITLDNLPHSAGHKISHSSVNCSTTDRDGVLRHAESLKIDGICTFASDVALHTSSYVSRCLGLRGPSEEIVACTSDKYAFREFLKKNDIAAPRYRIIKEVESFSSSFLYEEAFPLQYPLVVKPTRSSGSKGVTKVDENEPLVLKTAIQAAKKFSLNAEVIVEEFIEGVEVGGDAFLREGEFLFFAITEKHKEKFWVTGHSIPTNITRDQQVLVKSLVKQVCDALSYTEGPLNFDVIVDENRAVIVEMSVRTGGNGIPLLFKRSLGFDMELASIQYSMGEDICFELKDELEKYSTYVPFAETSGVLRGVPSEEQVRTVCPVLSDYFFGYDEGTRVKSMSEGGGGLGYIVFPVLSSGDYLAWVEKFKNNLKLTITS